MMEMRQEQRQTMLMRIALWLRLLLTSTDFQATEAQSAIIAVGLGAALLNPWNDTFGSGVGFRAMAALAPEWAWGLLLFWLGFIQIVVMIKRIHWRRRAGMFVLSCLWAFLAMMFYWSNPSGWGLVLFGVLAGSAGWAYWRLSLRS